VASVRQREDERAPSLLARERIPKGDGMAREKARRRPAATRRTDPAAEQSGGNRGSSNQGGPERSGEPRKDSAARMNTGDDAGSRSSQGRRDPEEREAGEERIGRTAEPPRGPLPEGAAPEDYLGGEKPHKTRRTKTRGASGRKNEVI
jgi:hypothetical protein